MPSNQRLFLDIGQGLSMVIGVPQFASWKSTERPSKPKTGTFGFNKQTNNLEIWNGTDWLAAPMNS